MPIAIGSPLPDATLTRRGALNNATPPQVSLDNLDPSVATNGQALIFDVGTGTWVPRTIPEGAISDTNRNMSARVTTGDYQLACDTALAAATAGWVVVMVNGIEIKLGDGTRSGVGCYFSKDGIIPTSHGYLTTEDYLYWTGSIAGYELDTADVIDFVVVKATSGGGGGGDGNLPKEVLQGIPPSGTVGEAHICATPGTGTYSYTGSFVAGRYYHTATLLTSGKVLVSGGYTGFASLATCEIFDPAGNGGVGNWTATGSLAAARYYHTATLLTSGKVLVSGGLGSTALATCEIFDPAGNGGVGSWTATGSLAAGRYYHTATLLTSGKVLISGGYTGSVYLATCEIFDPAGNGGVGSWTATGSMVAARQNHTATLLTNGKVLVSGGYNGSTILATCEIFDPAGNGGVGSWTATGSLATARGAHTATLLTSGKVLVSGGLGTGSVYLATCEIFDPAGNGGVGNWTATGSLAAGRYVHTATLLTDDKVLVNGGYPSSTILATCEIFDPAGNGGVGSWTATGSLATARGAHTATLLTSGKVLVSGGSNSSTILATCEIYDDSPGHELTYIYVCLIAGTPGTWKSTFLT